MLTEKKTAKLEDNAWGTGMLWLIYWFNTGNTWIINIKNIKSSKMMQPALLRFAFARLIDLKNKFWTVFGFIWSNEILQYIKVLSFVYILNHLNFLFMISQILANKINFARLFHLHSFVWNAESLFNFFALFFGLFSP